MAIPVMSTPVRWSGSHSSTSRRLLDASRVGEGGLLLVTGEAGLPIVGRDLHDEDGAFARHYHLGGAGVVLVRPGVRRLASFRAGGDARAALRSAVGLALGQAAEASALLRQAG